MEKTYIQKLMSNVVFEAGSDNVLADIGIDNPEEELAKAERNWKRSQEKKVKLTFELPESVHRNLKSRAALDGVAMKDYLIGLIDAKEKNDSRQ